MDWKQKAIDSISNYEQRVFIKFACLLDWTGGLTFQNLKRMLGGKALKQSTVKNLMSTIKHGNPDVQDHRSGRQVDEPLLAERITLVTGCFDESRHWSLRFLSNRLSIPKSSIQIILKDVLHMRKVLGKWVPHDLTPDQKEHRVLASQTNLADHKKDKSLLKRTLTTDESWVALYMSPDRSQMRSYLFPGEQPPTAPRDSPHEHKRMLIMAMDWNGICFWKLLPEKTTVTGQVYKDFLEDNIPKWLEGKSFKVPRLLDDNAKVHRARVVKEYLDENGIKRWFHPVYSPDISPLDFNCFGPLKRKLKGIRLQTWDEFEIALNQAVVELNESGTMTGVQQLPERWQRVIDAEGAYL